jgi:hypothetical protein
MVDKTPAEVCEDPVIFIIQTATYMLATDGNIDSSQYREQYQQGTLIKPEHINQSYVKNTVRSRRYSKQFACETGAG